MVLGSIVDPDQTCSIPGRSIHLNLVLLRDTLALIERTGEAGILLSLDQEKAFDRVDRNLLLNLLEHFGFGLWFRACITTLYNGAFMQVLVNDFLSNPIFLERGVRQGDALLPMLYVCAFRFWPVKSEPHPMSGAFSSQVLVTRNLECVSMQMTLRHL